MDRAGSGSSGCTVLIAAARWNTATSKKKEYGASIMVGFMTSREIVWSNPSSRREVLFARKLNTRHIRYGSWAGCSLRTWGRPKPIRLRCPATRHYRDSRSERSWENAFWRHRGDHHLDALPTEYGLKAIVRWPGPEPETEYVRLTTVALPTVFSLGGRGEEDLGFERLLFVTPADDNNFMVYTSDFIPKDAANPVDEREKARRAGPSAANVKEYDKRKYVPFKGQVWKEDYVCQSTQGNVGYRRENLATSDCAIILLRKQLLEAMEIVRNGGTPKGIIPKAEPC